LSLNAFNYSSFLIMAAKGDFCKWLIYNDTCFAGKDASNDFDDIGHSTSAVAMMDEFYVGDIDSSSIPSKVAYTPPSQPKYNQDKTPEFIIRILQFLVPLFILGLAAGIHFYTKSK